MKTRKSVSAVAACALLALAGCSGDTSGDEPAGSESTTSTSSESSTTKSSESSSSSSSSTSTSSEQPKPTSTGSSTPPAPSSTTNSGGGPTGYTEAPGVTDPTPMNKTIQKCGDVSIHEIGTTFFTDGTSGYTTYCDGVMSQQKPAPQPPATTPSRSGGGLTCAEIGMPVYRGQPNYDPSLDKDGDGIACESY